MLVVAVFPLLEIIIPAAALYLILSRWGVDAPDQRAALSLAAAPVVSCITITLGGAWGWQRSGFVALPLIVVFLIAVAAYARAPMREFFRQQIMVIWAFTIAFWLGQQLMIRCHGGAFWTWDWEHHYEVAAVTTQLLERGRFPFPNGRTGFLGTFAAPALTFTHAFWPFQIAVVCANATAVLASYLWGRRLTNAVRGGVSAAAMVLCCAGITQSAIFTWPKVFAGALTVLAFYVYADTDSSPGHRRLVGQALAGACLAAAFQAHELVSLYAGAFFAVCGVRFLRRPLRYPWIMLFVFAILLTGWILGKIHSYGLENAVYDNQYFPWQEMGASRIWQILWLNLRTGLLPMQVWNELSFHGWAFYRAHWFVDDREAQFLRISSDIFVSAFPLVGLAAFPWALIRWAHVRMQWCSADTVVLASIVLGGVFAMALQDGGGLGITQGSMSAPFLFGLACAGALAVHLPPWLAAGLWLTSLGQFLVFRSLWLWINIARPDSLNLAIKRSAEVVYAVEYHPLVLPVGFGLACASLLALLTTIARWVVGGRRFSATGPFQSRVSSDVTP